MDPERPSTVVAGSVLLGSLLLFVPYTVQVTRGTVHTVVTLLDVGSLDAGIVGILAWFAPLLLGFYVAGLVAEIRLHGYESIRSRSRARSLLAHVCLLWLVVATAVFVGQLGFEMYRWGLTNDTTWSVGMGVVLLLAIGWVCVRGLRAFRRGYRTTV